MTTQDPQQMVAVPRQYVQHLTVCKLKMQMGAKCECGLNEPGTVVAASPPAPEDMRERVASFAHEQRDNDRSDDWNAACDHIANAFRYENNPFGLAALSPVAIAGREGAKITQGMIDAALDAEWRGDQQRFWSLRELCEHHGDLSTRAIENGMRTALEAALNPPTGNPWEIAYDRDGPR